jgi:hypothetical protein
MTKTPSMDELIVAFIEQYGRPPTTVEIFMLVEARASTKLEHPEWDD